MDAQGPPLRGWVRSDETVVLGTVPMDTNGMLLLGVEDGKRGSTSTTKHSYSDFLMEAGTSSPLSRPSLIVQHAEHGK